MFWLLIIVLFQGDPAQPPDSISKAFTTEQACKDAADKAADAIAKDPSGYAGAALKCEVLSDPRTEKSAEK